MDCTDSRLDKIKVQLVGRGTNERAVGRGVNRVLPVLLSLEARRETSHASSHRGLVCESLLKLDNTASES